MLYPILSNDEAQHFESSLLKDASDEESALRKAGAAIGSAILEDYREVGSLGQYPRILVLAGSGHNAGDALVAVRTILEKNPTSEVTLISMKPLESSKPLLQKVFRELWDAFPKQITNFTWTGDWPSRVQETEWDVIIDGLLGLSFKPPLRENLRGLIQSFNKLIFSRAKLVASIDLPSGFTGDKKDAFIRSHFTYMPGIPKALIIHFPTPLLETRLRFLDIGFLKNHKIKADSHWIDEKAFQHRFKLRPANSEKRFFGKVHIVAGSTSMPGALLMTAKASLYSGVGLLTNHTPQQVVQSVAPQIPEAMWKAYEFPSDKIDADKYATDLLSQLKNADAVLIGPGLNPTEATLNTISKVVQTIDKPIVLDASALFSEVLESRILKDNNFPIILTPHVGEMRRLLKIDKNQDISSETIRSFCLRYKVTLLLKGPTTLICDGTNMAYFASGGPILARGGSGDILAGILTTFLAQSPNDPFRATIDALTLQGAAARLWAQDKGQSAVRTTGIFPYLTLASRQKG